MFDIAIIFCYYCDLYKLLLKNQNSIKHLCDLTEQLSVYCCSPF